MFKQMLVLSTLLFLPLQSAEKSNEVSEVSEALGHLIGKNLETMGVDFDLECVVRGIQNAASGKQSPMSESETIEAITLAQESAFNKKAEENLKCAESFLEKNASAKKVVSLEDGKVQYKIEKRGKGTTVQPHDNPKIRYVGRYLDGSVFGESQNEEVISLDETIQGFQKGLVGMKEGEKRTLFIHPEYGYGTQGFLPPNSLLTFEIEVVEANAPAQQAE